MKGPNRSYRVSSLILHPSSFVLSRRARAVAAGRLHLGRGVRVVPTLLIRTVTERPLLLGGLLEQEWCVALRACFNDWLVPVDHITVRIIRTTIKRFAAF